MESSTTVHIFYTAHHALGICKRNDTHPMSFGSTVKSIWSNFNIGTQNHSHDLEELTKFDFILSPEKLKRNSDIRWEAKCLVCELVSKKTHTIQLSTNQLAASVPMIFVNIPNACNNNCETIVLKNHSLLMGGPGTSRNFEEDRLYSGGIRLALGLITDHRVECRLSRETNTGRIGLRMPEYGN